MPKDCRGLELTAASDAAVAAYDRTVRAYLAFARDTGEHLKTVFKADAEMPMAHCLKGYFFQLFSNPALDAKADQALAAAEKAADARGATTRELMHIDALAAWRKGDLRRATDLWEVALIEHPLDILALKLGHFTHFYLGDAAELRDSVARVLPLWSETMPDYGFVLAMRAFGLEEAGDYAAAEAAGRRAVAINPGDIWGVHAVAHVLEMQGRSREGVAWLEGLAAGCEKANNFRFHTQWHQALFHFGLEQYDRVLALYDGKFRAEKTDDILDLSNAIAMLWRLEDEGVHVGTRWEELANIAERRANDHVLAFADAHFLMALAGAGRLDKAATMVKSMAGADPAAHASEAPILAGIGAALGDAIVAFRRGDFAAAVERLYPKRAEIRLIGGSHAQRDVFARLLILAALKAGKAKLARALLAERAARNPNSAWTWKRSAEALAALGDATAAKDARERAQRLLAA
ncbi:MAG TPA: tetratricopeptide repeat protein [Alphaproteobacteria bacterium]|jgi:tetratricopeptide (TPR) repeat protein